MESTLFTTLNANEEANISGGTKKKRFVPAFFLSSVNKEIKNTQTNTATNTATAGDVTIKDLTVETIGKNNDVKVTLNINTSATVNNTQTNNATNTIK